MICRKCEAMSRIRSVSARVGIGVQGLGDEILDPSCGPGILSRGPVPGFGEGASRRASSHAASSSGPRAFRTSAGPAQPLRRCRRRTRHTRARQWNGHRGRPRSALRARPRGEPAASPGPGGGRPVDLQGAAGFGRRVDDGLHVGLDSIARQQQAAGRMPDDGHERVADRFHETGRLLLTGELEARVDRGDDQVELAQELVSVVDDPSARMSASVPWKIRKSGRRFRRARISSRCARTRSSERPPA